MYFILSEYKKSKGIKAPKPLTLYVDFKTAK